MDSDSLEHGRRAGRRPVLAPVPDRPQADPLMLQDPSPEAPLPFGRYQLIRRIGAGGMGEVFLARESGAAPRACVVKKVLPNLVANRAFVGRFLDEAKVVVRLKHPQIARVYAMGEVNGEYFLSMEYVQGKTVSRFSRRLRDRKLVMPLGLALLIGERVCQGLQYAHDAKDEAGAPLHLVHRDLSPANVCISYKGDVKIIDFGAAQSTLKEEQTAPRVVIGNLTYMAPEQAKKQIVDGRADVYSTGVLLWELLAWHALPQKGDPIERWRRAANPSWDPPSRNNPSVPRDVDEIILKAVRKDVTERYGSAAELGEALARARKRHAPDVTEKDLGELLSRVFDREKVAEDLVLHEAVYGQTIELTPRGKQVVVPPTALAFEHTAVLAPAEILGAVAGATSGPNANNEDITDPGREPAPPPVDDGTPTPARDPRLTTPLELRDLKPKRTSFGVTFAGAQEPAIEPSLIQEIEALEADPSDDEEYYTRPYDTPGRWRRVALYGGVFVLAMSLGFLGVWLALR